MRNQHLLAMKRTFVRYVSHEIRSPLGTLNAGIELILKDLPSQTVTEDFTELLQGIVTSSQSAIDMLNDLLFYENIDAGLFTLEIENLRVFKLFKEDKLSSLKMLTRSYDLDLEIIDRANATGIEKDSLNNTGNLSIKTRNMIQKSHLQIDITKIFNQVIRNLVTNACKFTRPGGRVTLKFTVSSDSSMFTPSNIVNGGDIDIIGHFRVDVADTGAGIARENFGKIFGEFSQVNKSSLQGGGGSGLGLWICKQVVDLHKGIIDFTSDGEGRGSCFYFILPLFSTVSNEVVLKQSVVTNTSFRFQPNNDNNKSSIAAEQHYSSKINYFRNPSSVSPSPFTYSNNTNVPHYLNSFDNNTDTDIEMAHHVDIISPIDINSNNLLPDINDITDDGLFNVNNAFIIPPPNSNDLALGSLLLPTLPLSNLTTSSLTPFTTVPSVIQPAPRVLYVHDKQLELIIVDDSNINRKFLRKLIESEKSFKANISEFYDGQDLIDSLRANRSRVNNIDCIFLDNFMLKLNGPETAYVLRTEYGFLGTIIGITGNALAADVEHFKASGANNVLLKPVSLSFLLKELKKANLIS